MVLKLLSNIVPIFLLKIFLRYNSETVYLSIKVSVHIYKDIHEIYPNKNVLILSMLSFTMFLRLFSGSLPER